MSDVKRYDIVSDSCGWWPEGSTTGDYVLYDDYEDDTSALLVRITSLEREKEEAREKALEEAANLLPLKYAAPIDEYERGYNYGISECCRAMKGTKP